MWTGNTMTLMESLLASAMGFLIVFLVLIFLALVILAFAKFLSISAQKKTEPAPQVTAAVPEKDDSEIVSIVTSVICEELKVQPHELQINSICEV